MINCKNAGKNLKLDEPLCEVSVDLNPNKLCIVQQQQQQQQQQQ